MTLPMIRDAIMEAMRSAGLGDAVDSHPGRLSAEDLKTFAAKGRTSLRITLLGIPKAETRTAGTAIDAAWAAYVMALDTKDVARDDLAAYLVATVIRTVAGNVWGRTDLDEPRDIRADNLYSGTLDRRAVALWAVTWRQEWIPVAPEDLSSLDDLLRVHATWDLDPSGDGEPSVVDEIVIRES